MFKLKAQRTGYFAVGFLLMLTLYLPVLLAAFGIFIIRKVGVFITLVGEVIDEVISNVLDSKGGDAYGKPILWVVDKIDNLSRAIQFKKDKKPKDDFGDWPDAMA